MRELNVYDECRNKINCFIDIAKIDNVKLDEKGYSLNFKDGKELIISGNNSFEYKDKSYSIKSDDGNIYFTNDNWQTCQMCLFDGGISASKLIGSIIKEGKTCYFNGWGNKN